jgi:hypothetical protein
MDPQGHDPALWEWLSFLIVFAIPVILVAYGAPRQPGRGRARSQPSPRPGRSERTRRPAIRAGRARNQSPRTHPMWDREMDGY